MVLRSAELVHTWGLCCAPVHCKTCVVCCATAVCCSLLSAAAGLVADLNCCWTSAVGHGTADAVTKNHPLTQQVAFQLDFLSVWTCQLHQTWVLPVRTACCACPHAAVGLKQQKPAGSGISVCNALAAA